MTEEEKRIVLELGNLYNEFIKLPIYHPSDQDEFVRAIHTAQNIILSREGTRVMRKEVTQVSPYHLPHNTF